VDSQFKRSASFCPRLHCRSRPSAILYTRGPSGLLFDRSDALNRQEGVNRQFRLSTNPEVDSFVAIERGKVGSVNGDPLEHTHYEALYQAHYRRVLRLCQLLLNDLGEAEDVAQEVFMKLLEAMKTETREIAWAPWLTRVAVNACRDRRRSGWWKWWRAPRHATDTDEPPTLDLPSHHPTPEEAALGREIRGRIWQAFRQLPARQQEVFALRYLEGWSTDAVANTLGLSVGSVKQHLFRAVHRLRAVIGEEV
jgi:RNA polymerase sigma-70 factor (ECF subfamily)